MSKIKLAQYIDLLKEYNETTNIYSKKSYDKLDFHISDCVKLASLIENKKKIIMDMGSGSGLPSIPIAICNPFNTVYAIESKSRKHKFLELVKEKMNLTNYIPINMDVNEFIASKKIRPDIITAKAFAPYDKAYSIAKKAAKRNTELWIPISQIQFETLKSIKDTKYRLIQFPQDTFYYLKQTF